MVKINRQVYYTLDQGSRFSAWDFGVRSDKLPHNIAGCGSLSIETVIGILGLLYGLYFTAVICAL